MSAPQADRDDARCVRNISRLRNSSLLQIRGFPPLQKGAGGICSRGCDNAGAPPREAVMSDSLKTLLIIAFLILIVWNLGAGLYYMLVDKGETKRTVNALTKRIGLSVALILLVMLAIWMGWITPHGVGG